MIRKNIEKIVKEAAKSAGFASEIEIKINRPEEEIYGDYSTNFAMQASKTFKMAPKYIAENLKSHILILGKGMFERIEIMNPGFINFFLSKEYLQKQVIKIINQKEKFGNSKIGEEEKINVEFISANPTGSLHIGNGRSAFAGDVLASVLNKAGYKASKEYYINDAKSSKQIKELGKTALGQGTSYLTDDLKKKLEELKEKIKKAKNESEAGAIVSSIIQKDNRQFIEKKLKIKFDKWISEEKEIYKKNRVKKIFEFLKKKNLVYQKDGAWWIKTSQFGDEKDWVVIRETGEPTYLLSDIAYHKNKIERGFLKMINIWGADHQAHVQKMKSAVKMLGTNANLEVLILQLVTLKGGEKLSKRTGNVITLEDLVDEIGLDASRFFYLQKSLDTHMEIDLVLAKEQSAKNPVFYVQYAFARMSSILKKEKAGKRFSENLLNHSSELKLIKNLLQFPELVEDTAKDYQLQRLPKYAIDLSASFHQFYHDCRVISESKKLTKARLALVLASKIVLKNTLDLMGIQAKEQM
jgi:arginyl-tRNA synthetase